MIETKLIHGDCLEKLKELPDCSVDSVVTDPPYGLSFMGKKWDYDVPSVEVWVECLRVLKPGGHLLAFAGTRTQHRMAVRIEDAGFEIRDMIAWVYGSGFPKSLDVSKAIDRAAGAEREKVRVTPRADTSGTIAGSGESRPWIEKSRELGYHEVAGSVPITAAAAAWQGWGTALKPALEPITVARKPFAATVAQNVLEWGTGAINVDGCRVEGWKPQVTQGVNSNASSFNVAKERRISGDSNEGRWPANVMHDGSDEVVAGFPITTSGTGAIRKSALGMFGLGGDGKANTEYGDTGSAARFFYCAKASKKDRDDGNGHPTVKPTDLMRYLCRLITPPDGIVLDPFMGSGSTGKAAMLEGFDFIGIEREENYMEIAKARINSAKALV
jgi:site-specific DNA-methyltransferase (adenine-specific)